MELGFQSTEYECKQQNNENKNPTLFVIGTSIFTLGMDSEKIEKEILDL